MVKGAWNGYMFHTHLTLPGFQGLGPPNLPSESDIAGAGANSHLKHFLGWNGGLLQFDGKGVVSQIAGPMWWTSLVCDDIL